MAVLFSPPVAGREITNKQQKHWLSQKLQFRVILSSFLGLKAQEVRHVSSETAFNPLRGAIARDLFHFLCIQAPESKTACSESLGFCVWEAKSETRIKRNGPRVWGGVGWPFFSPPGCRPRKFSNKKKIICLTKLGVVWSVLKKIALLMPFCLDASSGLAFDGFSGQTARSVKKQCKCKVSFLGKLHTKPNLVKIMFFFVLKNFLGRQPGGEKKGVQHSVDKGE